MASNSRYEIIIFWSDEDDSFVAEVPELPECLADGATYQEAVTNAESAIRDWLDTAVQLRTFDSQTQKGRLQYA